MLWNTITIMTEASDTARDIVLTFTSLLIIVGLCFLLCRSIIKTYKNEHSKKSDDDHLYGLLNRKELSLAMKDFMDKYHQTNMFCLYEFELEDYRTLKELFGPKPVEKFRRIIIENVKKVLPKNTLFASLEADQFAILVRGRIPKEKLEALAHEIYDAITMPVSLNVAEGGKMNTEAYIGAVIYPSGGLSEGELYKNVELAMYMAKKNAETKFMMYSNENVGKNEEENLQYYREIKEAMRNKEFTLYYQPIINLKDESLYCYEALIRWEHPTLGILSPNKFLMIMERTGDINWVGKWGIEVICKQLIEWKKKNPKADFKISFNLSPKQLMNPQLVPDFQDIIRRYHVEASSICFEIVEFAMFERFGIVAENIKRLSEIGFSIAIDDFGLEANSLARLSVLPIDVIKLENDFIEKAENNFMVTKIVEMLVELAQNENKQIVAEGIETLENLEFIKKFNINLAQGYLFSKPLNLPDASDYLLKESWKNILHPIKEEFIKMEEEPTKEENPTTSDVPTPEESKEDDMMKETE